MLPCSEALHLCPKDPTKYICATVKLQNRSGAASATTTRLTSSPSSSSRRP